MDDNKAVIEQLCQSTSSDNLFGNQDWGWLILVFVLFTLFSWNWEPTSPENGENVSSEEQLKKKESD